MTSLFDRIARRYDVLNRVLSCGQDRRWRRALVRWMEQQGFQSRQASASYRVLDVATGTGDVLFMATARRRLADAELVGVDLSKNMLEQARRKQEDRGQSTGPTFLLGDARQLPFPSQNFHCLSIAFGLRNVQGRAQAWQEFHRVLAPGGRLLVLEFFPPRRSVIFSLFKIYFSKILPAVAGLWSPRADYAYLPASVETFLTFEHFCSEAQKHGFVYQRHRHFICQMCTLVELIKQ